MVVNVHRMVAHSTVFVSMAIRDRFVKSQVECFFIVTIAARVRMCLLNPCGSITCENGGQCQEIATNVYGREYFPEFAGTGCGTRILDHMIVVKICIAVIDDC